MQTTSDTTVGYTLLEPACLNRLCADPNCPDLSVLVLRWVVDEANARKLAGDGVFEVILANYHGEYPAIGLRGQPSEMSYEAACAAIDRLAVELVTGQSVEKLIAYAVSSRLDWRNVMSAIFKE